jgi:two-component system, NarL family, sensor kinase
MRALRSPRALQRAIDRLPAHAAVLDGAGSIVAVNEAWRRFGWDNGLRSANGCVGSSYLRACEVPQARSTEGPTVAHAIRRILNGGEQPFGKGYSCHSPGRTAWFHVEVASLRSRGRLGVLVTHVPIDEAAVRREIADAERHHIARELHDTTAQNLTSALLDLERVAKAQRATSGVVSAELEEAIQLCRRSLGDVRCLSYELSPPGFQVGHLVDSLKRLATTFARRTGMLVMLCAAPVTVPDDDLTLESSEALYRAAEESLYNVRRHSGASSVKMQVERTGGELQLRVIDDGRGLAPGVEPGKGLTDVQERLEACGGRMELLAGSAGTEFRAVVPGGREPDADDRHRR